MNVDAAAFYRVSETKGNSDNAALLKQAFAGEDSFLGGPQMDKFNGFDGDDDIDGRGGKGNDRLNSGAGEDVFVFNGDVLGKDTIENFSLSEGRIEISHPCVRSFYDLTLATVGSSAECTTTT